MASNTSVRNYRPKMPFNVPMKLLIPTTEKVKGVKQKTFPDPKDAPVFFGSFRTFGGTESSVDGVLVVEDTATIDTWFDPKFTAECRIYLCDSAKVYDIISDPEDIEMRHQYMQFKVRKVGGKT